MALQPLVAIILLLVGVAMATEVAMVTCPLPCDCSHDQRDMFIVDCTDKSLETLPDFSSLAGVKIYRVYLEMNRLQSLPGGSFQNLDIEGIDFSFNPLVNISASAFSGLESSLDFLVLKQTRLATAPRVFLQGMNKLRVLDLSNIDSTLYTHITKDTFPELPALQELSLIYCKVKVIEPSAFEGLESLIYLSLEENDLTSVPKAVASLGNLKDIDLTLNKILTLNDNDFLGLSKLVTIKLNANTNLKIAANAFQPCAETLEEFHLRWTDTKSIPTHTFKHLKNLKRLDLSGNMIKEIQPDAFVGLESLEELDLSENYGLFIPSEGAFKGLENSLEVLRLSSTSMTSLPMRSFESLTSLHKLALSSNGLTTLGNLSNVHAIHFDFSRNRIKVVEPGLFKAHAPIYLDLSYNDITRTDFFTEPCQFWELHLNGNPDLNCSCQLLTAGMKAGVVVRGSCAVPRELSGIAVKSRRSTNYTLENCNISAEELQRECTWAEAVIGGSEVLIHSTYAVLAMTLVAVTLTMVF